MPNAITIRVGQVMLTADLHPNRTAEAIWKVLPLQAPVSRWGDEIYFEIPVHLDESSDARQDMQVGELAYWPVGSALCIFFGLTPVSRGANPRAYSNVNPFGVVRGEATLLRDVKDGETIDIERWAE